MGELLPAYISLRRPMGMQLCQRKSLFYAPLSREWTNERAAGRRFEHELAYRKPCVMLLLHCERTNREAAGDRLDQ